MSLWFALTPAVIGILIALYLFYKIFMAHRLGKKVNAQRPDPKAFDDYPELQAMVDRFYILRYQARVEMDGKTLSAKEIDEGLQQLDDLIEAALAGGAYGAKVTGSGGGGCIIALCNEDTYENIDKNIKCMGGSTIVTKIANQGVRLEAINRYPL